MARSNEGARVDHAKKSKTQSSDQKLEAKKKSHFSSFLPKNKKEQSSQPSTKGSVNTDKSEVKNSKNEISSNFSSRPIGSTEDKNTKQPVETGGETAKLVKKPKSLMQRESVQLDFLVSLQEELGVDPKDVVVAFSNLSEAELAAPPEKTVDKVIVGLGLKGEQAENARGLFYGMLAQTATLDLATDVTDQGTKLSMEVLTERELTQRNLDSSIENLSSDFFSSNTPVPVSEMAHKIQAPQIGSGNLKRQTAQNAYKNAQTMTHRMAQNQTAQRVSESTPQSVSTTSESGLAAMAVTPAAVGGAPISAEGIESQFSPRELRSDTAKTSPPLSTSTSQSESSLALKTAGAGSGLDLSGLGSELLKGANEVGEAVSGLASATTQKAGSLGTASLGDSASSFATAIGASASGVAVETESLEPTNVRTNGTDNQISKELAAIGSQVEGIKQGETSPDNEGDPPEGQLRNFGEVQVTNGDRNMRTDGKSQFVINSPTPSSSDQSANVGEVVNQARYMIKEGGGEMKIRLAPDGLGEMNLKVSMEDGRINVEMVTSNSDVKKMMEKGMGDLKSTLATMKLDVEDIKVEVAKETSTGLDQKNQEESRSFEQKFLGDFQRQNRNFRNNFFTTGPDMRSSQVGERSEDAQRIVLNGKPPKEVGRLNVVA